MKKASDISGQHFGRLTAVRPTELRKYGSVVWECICDCGNTVLVSRPRLVSGETSSCGCLRSEKVSSRRSVNLAGQRFGRLLVLRPLEDRRYKRIVWECKCDCGNTTYVITNSLTCGSTLSCGCLHKEKVSNANSSNLSGKRFGKLTVIEPTDKRSHGSVVWRCVCDCGTTIDVPTWKLRNKSNISCGCTNISSK